MKRQMPLEGRRDVRSLALKGCLFVSMLLCIVSDALADQNSLERDYGIIAPGYRRPHRVYGLRGDKGSGLPAASAPASSCGRGPGLLAGTTRELAGPARVASHHRGDYRFCHLPLSRSLVSCRGRSIDLLGDPEIFDGAAEIPGTKLE